MEEDRERKDSQGNATKKNNEKMPKFLEHRQKCIKTGEIQAGHKRNKAQYKMTKDGKTQLLYTGEEMKIIDGKTAPEKHASKR